MSEKEKKTLPMTQAGLVRYFDDYQPKIQIKPEHVVAGIVGLILLEIFLKFFFV